MRWRYYRYYGRKVILRLFMTRPYVNVSKLQPDNSFDGRSVRVFLLCRVHYSARDLNEMPQSLCLLIPIL